MNNKIENMEEILRDHVNGFHIYSLKKPFSLIYASSNLLNLTGYSEEELIKNDEDLYLNLIHPDDRKIYTENLISLSQKEESLTMEYRLLKKDGTFIYVSDSFTSKRTDDGHMKGYSVVTDITSLKKEKNDLLVLNDTLPCGFLKYTCERHPKVTYVNKNMLDILRFPKIEEGELDYLELYRQNIYLMIPMEERSRLALCLSRISPQDAPVAGEMAVMRCDGTKAHLFGWVAKHVNEQGKEEFLSVCMDITERYKLNKEKETRNYIKALTDVYDKIFEYDYSGNTVKCLHWQNKEVMKWLKDVPMQMEDATEKWINTTVYSEDREKVGDFFKEFRQNNLLKSEEAPREITYREISHDNALNPHVGIFLKIDSSAALFCSRKISDYNEALSLRLENASLKNMQEMVMKFSEGIAAFEVKDHMVTPLYASDNVCEFFGYTKEEWLPMMKKAVPIKKLTCRCSVAYSDFMSLLAKGEAEYTYFDLNTKKERHIKAICSQKSPGTNLPFYVMLYNINEDEKNKKEDDSERVSIRTFGYFDVFVDGKPIAFRNEKSKELFALLVDRRGGFVTSEEAIGFLWENSPCDSAALARYRKVALRLKNLLEEYGISSVVESVNGKRRIVTELVKCDLYDFLSGKEEYKSLFKGNYLSNYSWGETTLAELLGSV